MRIQHALMGLLVAAPAFGQMSGRVLVDPNRTAGFRSITAAVQALFANGIDGPVEVLLAPGAYDESVLVPPIPGASPTATITFGALEGPGSTSLQGVGGDTFRLLGLSFARNRGLVFDGLDFAGGPGHAISASSYVEGVEIRDCTFAGNHVSTANGQSRDAVIVSDNVGVEAGWDVHHNRITLAPWSGQRSFGIHVEGGAQWDIHHNRIDLNGGTCGIWLAGNNAGVDRIYDNEFVGDLFATTNPNHNDVAALRIDAANYENVVVHNTFAVGVVTRGCCIATGGFVSSSVPIQNYVRGNVFTMTGPGTCVVVEANGTQPQPYVADGNVYWCPGGDIGRVGSGPQSAAFATIAAWRAAAGVDQTSIESDPLLRAPFAVVPDLRPNAASPIVGVAGITPAFVVDDFAGRLRDGQPDAGAHESTSFASFGSGCAGAAARVPQMGQSGPVALGAAAFAFELTQAAPNALTALVGGASRVASPLGPLPLNLGGGCALLVAPDAALVLTTDAAGAATQPYPLPQQSSLAGLDLFFQWLVVDPSGASALGVTVSAGAALQL